MAKQVKLLPTMPASHMDAGMERWLKYTGEVSKLYNTILYKGQILTWKGGS